MRKVFAVSIVLSLLILSVSASADVFNLDPGLTNLETVAVGDLGNTGELSGEGAGGQGPDRICGAVAYNYRIGKYEVTTAQYADFLNKVAKTDTYGLYSSRMWDDDDGCKIERNGVSGSYTYSVTSEWANRPVNYVSFWDACRFANWLHNGQPTGSQDASTTERGVYTLDGYNDVDGREIQRNVRWKWAIASEDEWYKAAYYKGGGTDSGYWNGAMQSDLPPNRDFNGTNAANFFNYDSFDPGYLDTVHYRTNVGAFINSRSYYGTFDQGGNVDEWTDEVISVTSRSVRGGHCFDFSTMMKPSRRRGGGPAGEGRAIGFRVVQSFPLPIGVRISDLSYTPLPPNPIKVWGKVKSLYPATLSDGRASITIDGLDGVAVNDFLIVTGNWSDGVLTVSSH